MRTASLVLLALFFTTALPARAQTAPSSPCLLCCALGLFCCTGTTPSVQAAFPWLAGFFSNKDETLESGDVTAETTAPAHQDVRAMAF